MARHDNPEEADPARLIQYSTSDIIIAFTSAPTPYSSLVFLLNHSFSVTFSFGSPSPFFILHKRMIVPDPPSVLLELPITAKLLIKSS